MFPYDLEETKVEVSSEVFDLAWDKSLASNMCLSSAPALFHMQEALKKMPVG